MIEPTPEEELGVSVELAWVHGLAPAALKNPTYLATGDVFFGSPKPLPIMPTIFVACIGEIVHRHFFRAIVSLPYGTKYSVTVHAVSVRETSTFPTSVHRLASFDRLGRAA